MEQTIETKHDATPQKPLTAFLVAQNTLVFLVLLVPGLNPIGWILAIPVTAIFVFVSGVWKAIWVSLDRRFRFHKVVRCVGFVLPVTVLVGIPTTPTKL